MHPLPSPQQLKKQFPLPDLAANFIEKSRKTLADILEGLDPRLLFIIGPCSIHNTAEGLAFAKRLKQLSERVKQTCFIAMRAYIEKPRTRAGWKGLAHDPHLDGSCDLSEGIARARAFLIKLAELEIPAATEFLSPNLVPYIEDTISWGCIGARTSSSQTHRTLASSLAMPVGFKNTVDGNIDAAINGVAVARCGHTLMHLNEEGRLCHFTSKGNPHTHVVLRGSLAAPNCDEKTVLDTLGKLADQELPERILIDCSHGNSGGHYHGQREAFESVIGQIREGNRHIAGLMLESNLEGGKQPISAYKCGVSVTDGCLDFSTTEALVLSASSEKSINLTHS